MELNKYIDIQPEIAEALTENLPVVALESTILSHGMPYPENLDFAAEVERAVRSEGAIPATMAIVGGRVKIGLTKDELELMCKAENVGKVSRRDFAIYVAEGRDGATTVASTMMCCAYAGIQVFATGGIGGTYAVMPELFQKVYDLSQAGEMKLAAEIQNEICRIIYKMCSAHGNLYAVMKAILKKHGMDIGSVRKPLPALIDSDLAVVDEASAMIDAAIAKYC